MYVGGVLASNALRAGGGGGTPFDCLRKCAITIDNTFVASDLTNFPLLVTEDMLPSEMFDSDGSNPAQNGGGDIRFSSDSAGTTQLACEVVTFTTDADPANGVAVIWVKVPSVAGASDTTIYVWYNTVGASSQPAVTDTYGRNAVWADYEAVLHLNEAVNTTSGGYVDATGNGHDGTGVSMAEAAVAGKFGNAASFDGSADYIAVGGTFNTDTALSVTGWIKQDTETVDQGLFGTAPAATDSASFQYFRDEFTTDRYGVAWRGNALSTVAAYGTTNPGTTPRFCGITWPGSGASNIYVDGASENTVTPGTRTNYTSDIALVGAVPGFGAPSKFNDGWIQEWRWRYSVLSANWLAAEYANQNSPATFAAAGTPGAA